MAMDMFMKIDGITGESKDSKASEVGTIDVLAWSWGASQSGTTHMGTGSGAGKANIQDMSFTHYLDDSSPVLHKRCIAGTHLKDAILTVRKAGDKPLIYLKITMTDVLVTSVSTGGSGGEDKLTENVSLNFGKIKVEYFKQTATGSGETGQTYEYHIAENNMVG